MTAAGQVETIVVSNVENPSPSTTWLENYDLLASDGWRRERYRFTWLAKVEGIVFPLYSIPISTSAKFHVCTHKRLTLQ